MAEKKIRKIEGIVTSGRWQGKIIDVDFGNGKPDSMKVTLDGKLIPNESLACIVIDADINARRLGERENTMFKIEFSE